MLRHIVRHGFLVFAFLFLFSNISSAASESDLAEKFAHAQSLEKKGEIKQAIYVYTELIESNPQLPAAYNNLAALYLKQKNTKQAKYILEKGLYADKGYGALYKSLTAINVAMAREAYSKALQIDLKPSDITIASLKYNEDKDTAKPIVISKSDKTTESQQVTEKQITREIVKQATEPKAVKVSEFSGEIKRPIIKRKKINKSEAIETVLQAWSAAWSAQATNLYLSFYHKQYKPANGMSHNGWVQSRRYRLKKPRWIKVALSDFNIKKNTGKQAIVNFKQSYQSNSFRDISKKQMVLLYTDEGWRIFREKSL